MRRIDKFKYTVPTEESHLRLGLLGYTSQLSIDGVKQIAENNKDEIVKCVITSFEAHVVFKDGSIVKSISHNGNLRGQKFDQLILFDDERWLIHFEKSRVIQRIVEETMHMSSVAPEWQIIRYLDFNRAMEKSS